MTKILPLPRKLLYLCLISVIILNIYIGNYEDTV